MDYPIHIDTLSMELSILNFKRLSVKIKKKMMHFLSDPDEMWPYAAFHLGLHCLPKYLFTDSRMTRV